jgi:hypothetical protein
MYSQDKPFDFTPEDLPYLVNTLKKLPLELREALVVRILDEIDMYGKTIKDPFPGGDRYSLQVHVYPWTTAGATAVPLHQDIFGYLSVALVWNVNHDKRPAEHPDRIAKIPDYWRLPEGYLQPKPCRGGEEGVSHLPSLAMDQAEVAILNKSATKEAAYQEIAQSLGLENLPRKSHKSEYDENLLNCALKELREEIGIDLRNKISDPGNHPQVSFIEIRENSQAAHMINGVYLVEVEKQKYNSPQVLLPDGTEIGFATWGKLKLITSSLVQNQLRYTYPYGPGIEVEIPMSYALSIAAGVKKFRDQEIATLAKKSNCELFNCSAAIESWILKTTLSSKLNPDKMNISEILGVHPKQLLLDQLLEQKCEVPGNSPNDKNHTLQLLGTLGSAAEHYHQKLLCIVERLNRLDLSETLSCVQLKEIAEQEPMRRQTNIAKEFIERTTLAKLLRNSR